LSPAHPTQGVWGGVMVIGLNFRFQQYKIDLAMYSSFGPFGVNLQVISSTAESRSMKQPIGDTLWVLFLRRLFQNRPDNQPSPPWIFRLSDDNFMDDRIKPATVLKACEY
jgi:hypothetical protein